MKTTKAQFELFQKECQKWLDFFGVKGWHVVYRHQKIEGCRGECSYKLTGRVATISLSTHFEEWKPVSNDDIRKTAFHEVCELMLSRINLMALNRIANHEDAANEEIHNIIRTLENTVFKENI